MIRSPCACVCVLCMNFSFFFFLFYVMPNELNYVTTRIELSKSTKGD